MQAVSWPIHRLFQRAARRREPTGSLDGDSLSLSVRHSVGVREDYVMKVRPDLLEEHDGPTFVNGLQGLQGARIILPRARELRPDPEPLHRRYERFRAAS